MFVDKGLLISFVGACRISVNAADNSFN